MNIQNAVKELTSTQTFITPIKGMTFEVFESFSHQTHEGETFIKKGNLFAVVPRRFHRLAERIEKNTLVWRREAK